MFRDYKNPKHSAIWQVWEPRVNFPISQASPFSYPSPSASPGRMPQVKKEARAGLLLHERVIFATGDTEASALGWLRGTLRTLGKWETLALGF